MNDGRIRRITRMGNNSLKVSSSLFEFVEFLLMLKFVFCLFVCFVSGLTCLFEYIWNGLEWNWNGFELCSGTFTLRTINRLFKALTNFSFFFHKYIQILKSSGITKYTAAPLNPHIHASNGFEFLMKWINYTKWLVIFAYFLLSQIFVLAKQNHNFGWVKLLIYLYVMVI